MTGRFDANVVSTKQNYCQLDAQVAIPKITDRFGRLIEKDTTSPGCILDYNGADNDMGSQPVDIDFEPQYSDTWVGVESNTGIPLIWRQSAFYHYVIEHEQDQKQKSTPGTTSIDS